MNILTTPISDKDISALHVGDMICVCGDIFCGRDMVLPKIVELAEKGEAQKNGIVLGGGLIFHTAVSVAGIGPTSSNKAEIEASIVPLSKAGIKIHLGKGRISDETIRGMCSYGSAYAIVPPVTALLGNAVLNSEVSFCKELGMEAFYRLKVDKMPMIIAAVNGRSIYE